MGVAFRVVPTVSRRLGFEIMLPAPAQPAQPGEPVRCRLHGDDGQPVAEVSLEIFKAALVIDRDGILEEKVATAAASYTDPGARTLQTIPIEVNGASGYRADVELVRPMGTPRPELPYIYLFVIAPQDLGVEGGVLLSVRSQSAEWPGLDELLQSLKILTKRSTTAPGNG